MPCNETSEATWERGHKAGRAFERSQGRQIVVDEVRVWLVDLQEQGYLPTWVADSFSREFDTRTPALPGQERSWS